MLVEVLENVLLSAAIFKTGEIFWNTAAGAWSWPLTSI